MGEERALLASASRCLCHWRIARASAFLSLGVVCRALHRWQRVVDAHWARALSMKRIWHCCEQGNRVAAQVAARLMALAMHAWNEFAAKAVTLRMGYIRAVTAPRMRLLWLAFHAFSQMRGLGHDGQRWGLPSGRQLGVRYSSTACGPWGPAAVCRPF